MVYEQEFEKTKEVFRIRNRRTDNTMVKRKVTKGQTTMKLLNQRFPVAKLKSSFRQFYGHYHDLFNRYRVSMSQMTMDMFRSS
jgi:hypothetical protein